jgi:hypothetical protein
MQFGVDDIYETSSKREFREKRLSNSRILNLT